MVSRGITSGLLGGLIAAGISLGVAAYQTNQNSDQQRVAQIREVQERTFDVRSAWDSLAEEVQQKETTGESIDYFELNTKAELFDTIFRLELACNGMFDEQPVQDVFIEYDVSAMWLLVRKPLGDELTRGQDKIRDATDEFFDYLADELGDAKDGWL